MAAGASRDGLIANTRGLLKEAAVSVYVCGGLATSYVGHPLPGSRLLRRLTGLHGPGRRADGATRAKGNYRDASGAQRRNALRFSALRLLSSMRSPAERDYVSPSFGISLEVEFDAGQEHELPFVSPGSNTSLERRGEDRFHIALDPDAQIVERR